MAVNLSPVYGAGAQIFSNIGTPLSGGQIYTYEAGTTIPEATYTSASGAIAQANPIILDASGRVPSGEIWLTDGVAYKFVLMDANNVLIATYDNLVGINSNFVSFEGETEIQTATAGQTVFTLTTMEYAPGTNNLTVFVDGVNQYEGSTYSYTETSGTVVTFEAGLHVGALVKFTTAQLLSSGATAASLVTYKYPDSNSVSETVQNRLAECISVIDFGAVGDGVTDNTTAITNATIAALTAGKTLFFPSGQYYIASTITINNASYSNWSTFSWLGEEFITGNALYQNSVSGVTQGTVIVTNGTSAVQVTMDGFDNESVRFNNMSFYNKGSIGLTSAIIVNKNSTSYVRGQEFNKLGFYNFDTCVVLQGQQVSINNNYFGPTTVQENFVYGCGAGLYINNAYVNLFQISNSLYHSCTKYGVQVNSSSGAIMSVTNTHFEGCEPAGLLAGGLITEFNFDNMSAEACGAVSGYGVLKASSTINSLTVNVSNSSYNGTGFALMPYEFRLNRGATINASCPVQASGYGWMTNTPELVTPVVSNNATYNQTDTSTLAMCPVNDNVGRQGNRVFDKFEGYNTASQTSLSPANSINLPEGIRSKFVGTNSSTTLMWNLSDSYTAPSNGYIYSSWIGKFTATDNGFNATDSQVEINSVNTLVTGYTFSPYTGNFVLVSPIASGQSLTNVILDMYTSPSWVTGVYTTFESSLLNMSDAACGYPRITTTEYSLTTANTLNLVDYTNSTTPYAINVKLFFNNGALGYKEYVITGDGAVAANKVYTSVASVVVSGVSVSTATGGNSQMYNITVSNTSGNTINVTKQVTYIS